MAKRQKDLGYYEPTKKMTAQNIADLFSICQGIQKRVEKQKQKEIPTK